MSLKLRALALKQIHERGQLPELKKAFLDACVDELQVLRAAFGLEPNAITHYKDVLELTFGYYAGGRESPDDHPRGGRLATPLLEAPGTWPGL